MLPRTPTPARRCAASLAISGSIGVATVREPVPRADEVAIVALWPQGKTLNEECRDRAQGRTVDWSLWELWRYLDGLVGEIRELCA